MLVAYSLVSDGETLLVVSRLLQLVDHSISIVLNRDVAVALCIHYQIILTQTIVASLLSFLVEYTGRREEYPVDVVLVHQRVEIEIAQRANTTHNLFRDSTRIYNSQTRSAEQCAGTADDEQTLHATLLCSLENLWIVLCVMRVAMSGFVQPGL